MPIEPQHPVPVFTLPGMVLFPGVRLPLHVFDLRDRALVRDVLTGGRVLAVALPVVDRGRDDRGSPEFHPLGCLARIEEAAWLPDDCYHIRLLGLARAQFGRTVREYPYRWVRSRPLPQEPFSEDDTLIQLERRALLEARARCGGSAGGTGPTPLDERLAFEPLVNCLCMELDACAEDKLALLALDSVLERSRRVRERMEAQALHGRGTAGGERN